MRQRIVSWVLVSAGVLLPVSAAQAADECLAKPNAPATQGTHWYFNTDRATNRKCWFLGEAGTKQRLPPRVAAPAKPPAAPVQPEPKTATTGEASEIAQANPQQPRESDNGPRLAAPSAPATDQPNGGALLAPASMTNALSPAEPAQGEAEDDPALVWPAPPPVQAAAPAPPPAPAAAPAPPSGSSFRLAALLVFLAGAFASTAFAARAAYRQGASPLTLARRAPSGEWR